MRERPKEREKEDMSFKERNNERERHTV